MFILEFFFILLIYHDILNMLASVTLRLMAILAYLVDFSKFFHKRLLLLIYINLNVFPN